MIVLNTLAKNDMFKEDITTYYLYLRHLMDIGIDKDLIKVFEKIYLPVDNENPKNLLKMINPTLEKEIDYKVFQKEYKIKH